MPYTPPPAPVAHKEKTYEELVYPYKFPRHKLGFKMIINNRYLLDSNHK